MEEGIDEGVLSTWTIPVSWVVEAAAGIVSGKEGKK